MKKPFLRTERCSEVLTNTLLLGLAAFAFTRPPANESLHLKTSIAGTVIFEGDVTTETWCQVSAWDWCGTHPACKTQQVVFAQYKRLPLYRNPPADLLDWVHVPTCGKPEK